MATSQFGYRRLEGLHADPRRPWEAVLALLVAMHPYLLPHHRELCQLLHADRLPLAYDLLLVRIP